MIQPQTAAFAANLRSMAFAATFLTLQHSKIQGPNSSQTSEATIEVPRQTAHNDSQGL